MSQRAVRNRISPKAAAAAAANASVIRPSRAIRAFVAAEALAAVGYFGPPPTAAKAACYAVLGAAPVVALVAGVRRYRPAQPLAWHLLAAGQGLFILGDTVNNLDAWVLRGATPSSLVDPLYLAVYPLQAAGLLLLIRSAPGPRAATAPA